MKRRLIVAGLLLNALTLLAADLPKAETLMDAYVTATGGATAYKSIKTMVVKSSIEFVGQGIKGTSTAYSLYPDRSYTIMDLAGIGKIETGTFDGRAWQHSAMQGSRLASGEEKQMSLRLANLYGVVDWRKDWSTAETEAEEEVEGTPCYRVLLKAHAGGKPVYLWISKKDGLTLKTRMTMVSPMGELQIDSISTDYRKAGGILLPHKVTQMMGPQKIVSEVQQVLTNEGVDNARLTPPAEIQALIAKEQTTK
jgi:hypothetical protein